MGTIRIDSSSFPVVIIDPPPEFSIADTDIALEELRAVSERGLCAFVMDLTRVTRPDAVRRRHVQSIASKFYTGEGRGRVVAEAMVTRSALIRGTITAYYWFARPEHRLTRVFADRESAVKWCLDVVALSRTRRATETTA